MIYNLEKIDVVINKIIRDLGLGAEEIPYQDFIEWAAEALLHIGAFTQLKQKEDLVIIDDYRGYLPCDLYKVVRLLKASSVEKSDGTFYGGTFTQLLFEAGIEFKSLPGRVQLDILQGGGLEPKSVSDKYEYLSDRLSHNGNLIGNPVVNQFTSNDYNINFNIITTGFRQGFIKIQYLALPVDDNGFPLVPDDQSFRDAIFWKCAYQLCMRNPEIFKNKKLQDFDYVRQMWLRYCVQARANAIMPDVDTIQRLANNWMRLVNITNFDQDLYNGIGKQQNLNLDGRY